MNQMIPTGDPNPDNRISKFSSKCEVCDSSAVSLKVKIPDYHCTELSPFHNKLFRLNQCDDCKHLYVVERLNQDQLSQHYKSGNYLAFSHYADSAQNTKLKKIADVFRDDIVRFLTKEKLQVFEIGTSFGHLLQSLSEKGHFVAGLEPSAAATEGCRQKGYDVQNTTLEAADLTGIKADAVVSLSVFEHVYDLESSIQQVKNLMHKESIFYIEAPTVDSIHYKIFGKYFILRFVNKKKGIFHPIEHLRYFSKKSMRNYLERHFDLVQELQDPRYGPVYKKSLLKKLLSIVLNASLTGNIVFKASRPR